MKTIKERAKEYAPDPFLAALERKAYIAGAKDQQYIDNLLIEQLIDKSWSLANSMYQVGRDKLIPLTKDEFIKTLEE